MGANYGISDLWWKSRKRKNLGKNFFVSPGNNRFPSDKCNSKQLNARSQVAFLCLMH